MSAEATASASTAHGRWMPHRTADKQTGAFATSCATSCAAPTLFVSVDVASPSSAMRGARDCFEVEKRPYVVASDPPRPGACNATPVHLVDVAALFDATDDTNAGWENKASLDGAGASESSRSGSIRTLLDALLPLPFSSVDGSSERPLVDAAQRRKGESPAITLRSSSTNLNVTDHHGEASGKDPTNSVAWTFNTPAERQFQASRCPTNWSRTFIPVAILFLGVCFVSFVYLDPVMCPGVRPPPAASSWLSAVLADSSFSGARVRGGVSVAHTWMWFALMFTASWTVIIATAIGLQALIRAAMDALCAASRRSPRQRLVVSVPPSDEMREQNEAHLAANGAAMEGVVTEGEFAAGGSENMLLGIPLSPRRYEDLVGVTLLLWTTVGAFCWDLALFRVGGFGALPFAIRTTYAGAGVVLPGALSSAACSASTRVARSGGYANASTALLQLKLPSAFVADVLEAAAHSPRLEHSNGGSALLAGSSSALFVPVEVLCFTIVPCVLLSPRRPWTLAYLAVTALVVGGQAAMSLPSSTDPESCSPVALHLLPASTSAPNVTQYVNGTSGDADVPVTQYRFVDGPTSLPLGSPVYRAASQLLWGFPFGSPVDGATTTSSSASSSSSSCRDGHCAQDFLLFVAWLLLLLLTPWLVCFLEWRERVAFAIGTLRLNHRRHRLRDATSVLQCTLTALAPPDVMRKGLAGCPSIPAFNAVTVVSLDLVWYRAHMSRLVRWAVWLASPNRSSAATRRLMVGSRLDEEEEEEEEEGETGETTSTHHHYRRTTASSSTRLQASIHRSLGVAFSKQVALLEGLSARMEACGLWPAPGSGDTYLAVCGLPGYFADHPARSCCFATAAQQLGVANAQSNAVYVSSLFPDYLAPMPGNACSPARGRRATHAALLHTAGNITVEEPPESGRRTPTATAGGCRVTAWTAEQQQQQASSESRMANSRSGTATTALAAMRSKPSPMRQDLLYRRTSNAHLELRCASTYSCDTDGDEEPRGGAPLALRRLASSSNRGSIHGDEDDGSGEGGRRSHQGGAADGSESAAAAEQPAAAPFTPEEAFHAATFDMLAHLEAQGPFAVAVHTCGGVGGMLVGPPTPSSGGVVPPPPPVATWRRYVVTSFDASLLRAIHESHFLAMSVDVTRSIEGPSAVHALPPDLPADEADGAAISTGRTSQRSDPRPTSQGQQCALLTSAMATDCTVLWRQRQVFISPTTHHALSDSAIDTQFDVECFVAGPGDRRRSSTTTAASSVPVSPHPQSSPSGLGGRGGGGQPILLPKQGLFASPTYLGITAGTVNVGRVSADHQLPAASPPMSHHPLGDWSQSGSPKLRPFGGHPGSPGGVVVSIWTDSMSDAGVASVASDHLGGLRPAVAGGARYPDTTAAPPHRPNATEKTPPLAMQQAKAAGAWLLRFTWEPEEHADDAATSAEAASIATSVRGPEDWLDHVRHAAAKRQCVFVEDLDGGHGDRSGDGSVDALSIQGSVYDSTHSGASHAVSIAPESTWGRVQHERRLVHGEALGEEAVDASSYARGNRPSGGSGGSSDDTFVPGTRVRKVIRRDMLREQLALFGVRCGGVQIHLPTEVDGRVMVPRSFLTGGLSGLRSYHHRLAEEFRHYGDGTFTTAAAAAIAKTLSRSIEPPASAGIVLPCPLNCSSRCFACRLTPQGLDATRLAVDDPAVLVPVGNWRWFARPTDTAKAIAPRSGASRREDDTTQRGHGAAVPSEPRAGGDNPDAVQGFRDSPNPAGRRPPARADAIDGAAAGALGPTPAPSAPSSSRRLWLFRGLAGVLQSGVHFADPFVESWYQGASAVVYHQSTPPTATASIFASTRLGLPISGAQSVMAASLSTDVLVSSITAAVSLFCLIGATTSTTGYPAGVELTVVAVVVACVPLARAAAVCWSTSSTPTPPGPMPAAAVSKATQVEREERALRGALRLAEAALSRRIAYLDSKASTSAEPLSAATNVMAVSAKVFAGPAAVDAATGSIDGACALVNADSVMAATPSAVIHVATLWLTPTCLYGSFILLLAHGSVARAAQTSSIAVVDMVWLSVLWSLLRPLLGSRGARIRPGTASVKRQPVVARPLTSIHQTAGGIATPADPSTSLLNEAAMIPPLLPTPIKSYMRRSLLVEYCCPWYVWWLLDVVVFAFVPFALALSSRLEMWADGGKRRPTDAPPLPFAAIQRDVVAACVAVTLITSILTLRIERRDRRLFRAVMVGLALDRSFDDTTAALHDVVAERAPPFMMASSSSLSLSLQGNDELAAAAPTAQPSSDHQHPKSHMIAVQRRCIDAFVVRRILGLAGVRAQQQLRYSKPTATSPSIDLYASLPLAARRFVDRSHILPGTTFVPTLAVAVVRVPAASFDVGIDATGVFLQSMNWSAAGNMSTTLGLPQWVFQGRRSSFSASEGVDSPLAQHVAMQPVVLPAGGLASMTSAGSSAATSGFPSPSAAGTAAANAALCQPGAEGDALASRESVRSTVEVRQPNESTASAKAAATMLTSPPGVALEGVTNAAPGTTVRQQPFVAFNVANPARTSAPLSSASHNVRRKPVDAAEALSAVMPIAACYQRALREEAIQFRDEVLGRGSRSRRPSSARRRSSARRSEAGCNVPSSTVPSSTPWEERDLSAFELSEAMLHKFEGDHIVLLCHTRPTEEKELSGAKAQRAQGVPSAEGDEEEHPSVGTWIRRILRRRQHARSVASSAAAGIVQPPACFAYGGSPSAGAGTNQQQHRETDAAMWAASDASELRLSLMLGRFARLVTLFLHQFRRTVRPSDPEFLATMHVGPALLGPVSWGNHRLELGLVGSQALDTTLQIASALEDDVGIREARLKRPTPTVGSYAAEPPPHTGGNGRPQIWVSQEYADLLLLPAGGGEELAAYDEEMSVRNSAHDSSSKPAVDCGPFYWLAARRRSHKKHGSFAASATLFPADGSSDFASPAADAPLIQLAEDVATTSDGGEEGDGRVLSQDDDDLDQSVTLRGRRTSFGSGRPEDSRYRSSHNATPACDDDDRHAAAVAASATAAPPSSRPARLTVVVHDEAPAMTVQFVGVPSSVATRTTRGPSARCLPIHRDWPSSGADNVGASLQDRNSSATTATAGAGAVVVASGCGRTSVVRVTLFDTREAK